MTKRVENSDNLQKIASSSLEVTNKDEVKLKAQIDKQTANVTKIHQQLSGAGEAVVNYYVVHFHKTYEYGDLGLYWRKVTYNEVFEKIGKLYPHVNLVVVNEEFLPTKPSTHSNGSENSNGGGSEAEPQ